MELQQPIDTVPDDYFGDARCKRVRVISVLEKVELLEIAMVNPERVAMVFVVPAKT